MKSILLCSACESPGKLMLCFSCNLYFHALCGGYARHIEKGGYCMKPLCQKAKAHRYIKPKEPQLPLAQQPAIKPPVVLQPAQTLTKKPLEPPTHIKPRESTDKNPPPKSVAVLNSQSLPIPNNTGTFSFSSSSNIFSSDSSSPQESEESKALKRPKIVSKLPLPKDPNITKKPKQASFTCHRCKESFPNDQIITCYNENCSENFCFHCLTMRYDTIPKELPKDWECFVCCNTCRCHICRNNKSAKPRNIVPDFPIRQSKEGPRQIEECHACHRKSRTYKMAKCKQCKRAYCVFCLGTQDSVCDACQGFCECFDCRSGIYSDLKQLCISDDLKLKYAKRGDSLLNINGYWIRELK